MPGFALFVLIMVYPTVQAALISLQKWAPVPGGRSEWIGLDNYLKAFSDPVFLDALVNAGAYTVVTVPLQMSIGLGLALLLDGAMPGRTVYRVLLYLPVVTSWVVVSLLFQYMFQSGPGVANLIVVDVLGLVDAPVPWFLERWTAFIAIGALGVWKGVGWAMIVYLAALTAVPRDQHEAAALDGAGRWGRFVHVALPALRPASIVISILLIIGGFNVFISVLLMTGGGPANATQVPLTYMYQQAFEFLNFGYGSAIAFSLTLVILAISAVQYLATRERKGG
ncbi:carbohydrate ABC transporter permease [Microcella sp.]|uniref:carbohydrate ABC transporter permease n=1 Tax=Microcella sp. TaxID=1913979 RepID=UPI00260AD5E3|nr:sugar ABC transporter permease [Microcella sp.]